MEKRSKSENELIQEGLERFLEQELKGLSSEREPEIPLKKQNTKPGNDTIQMIDLDRPAAGQKGFVPEDQDGLDLDFEEQAPQRNKSVQGNIANKKSTGKSKAVNKDSISGRKENNRKTNSRNERSKREGTGKNKEKNMLKAQNSKKDKKKKRKSAKWKKLVIVLVVIFLVIMAALYAMVGSVYKKMNYEKVDSYSLEPMKEDGVINILLIGNDSRENGEDGRSDAMILVSISNKTKTITMTSLLRDMYVEIPGHDGNRLNAAYSYGGPELLMQTIEQNFDIPVHRYALVNFQAFANLVDAVGGVDLELSNEEVNYVNGYLVEYNMLENRPEGTDYLDTSLSGMIHLNGPQALAYTRNRYIGTDFARTERQRKVLSAVMKKMPATLAVNSGELIDGLFPNLTTNLTQNECFSLSLNGSKLLTYELVQQAIPAEGTYSNATIRSMAVLEVDFEANKKILKESIYGE